MATDISAFLKFSDNTMGAFLAEGVTESTATAISTGGNGINQVSGIAAGNAFNGKVAIAASVIVNTDSASTGCFSYAYLLGPDGKIMTGLPGGGVHCAGLVPIKPTRMVPGVVLFAAWDAAADAVSPANVGIECTDGTTDKFSVALVADTVTELLNKDGNGLGSSLVNKVISRMYSTYSSSNGLNDDGGGFSSLYIQSSDGQLKLCIPPGNGKAHSPTEWMSGFGTIVRQNDQLLGNAGV